MKPAAFDFVRARSLAEATQLLSQVDDARIIAGSQSLGPMLNLRMVQPRILVDITGIPVVSEIAEDGDGITVGACITTGNIEDGRLPIRGLAMLPEIASQIAYRAVRNRGTIGGSVCHADPAADWPSVLCALNAECIITGTMGSRRLPIQQFVIGPFGTALDRAEMLEAIKIPRLSTAGRWGYVKLCRRTGEFAMAIAAVLWDPLREQYRVVIGATSGRPIVVDDARLLVCGPSSADKPILDQTEVLKLFDRHGILNDCARQQHLVALQRAFSQAMSR
jgi:carbon-monoxide dehydrogenase medium subunit